jgi:hypothetical protein
MPQRGGPAPRRPFIVDARSVPDGVRLRWLRADDRTTEFAVYRFDGVRLVRDCDLADATHLVVTGRATNDFLQSFTDTTVERGKVYTYAMTALDRSHNQSGPALPRFAVTAGSPLVATAHRLAG